MNLTWSFIYDISFRTRSLNPFHQPSIHLFLHTRSSLTPFHSPDMPTFKRSKNKIKKIKQEIELTLGILRYVVSPSIHTGVVVSREKKSFAKNEQKNKCAQAARPPIPTEPLNMQRT